MFDALNYNSWRKSLAAALAGGCRDEFKRLLAEATLAIDPKRLFAAIVEDANGNRSVVVVDGHGDDLRSDTMITPEHKADFLNATFESETEA